MKNKKQLISYLLGDKSPMYCRWFSDLYKDISKDNEDYKSIIKALKKCEKILGEQNVR